MNTAVAAALTPASRAMSARPAALAAAARFWFVAAVIGQYMFAYYVARSYIGNVLQGDLEGMKAAMYNAYEAGDPFGNLAVALHMTLAFAVLVCGPLQLVPTIRARLPAFHRWNGRLYIAALLCTSLAGLLMIWGRGTYSLGVRLGGTGNALLVFVFLALAVRAALARDFLAHRRWALRLFVSGLAVWFFRVILMAWVAALGPVGIDFTTASGPFLELMAFGQYLIPLAILEGYLLAKQSERPLAHWAMAAILVACSLVMCGGIVVAGMAEWLR